MAVHRLVSGAALLLFLGLWAAAAQADELHSALSQPLREVSHTVDVSVAEGIATYRVRRVFANAGTQADEARIAIDLPYGAAATGLRIRARTRWYDGELLEAERAAQLYQELTGHGAFAPKDPALLQWLWADKLSLQVFPVFPGSTSTVEYTLTVPTRYERGRVLLSYPRSTQDPEENVEPEFLPLAVPVLTVRPNWGDATTRVLVDGLIAAPNTPISLAAPPPSPWAADDDGSASYVASTIEVPSSRASTLPFATAHLTLEIEHTYQSDLVVELLTPAGGRLLVERGQTESGSANDVRGQFEVALPAGTKGAGSWHLIVSDHAGLDAGTLSQWTLRLGEGANAIVERSLDTPLFIPDAPENAGDQGLATLELAAPPNALLTARLGKVVASREHAFGRLEIDVAQMLSPLPNKAQLVFVLDASHSQGPDGVEAQLALIAAYLGHVPDAELELVLYRRDARALFGGFIPASTFAARLASARAEGKLVPENGSDLARGAGHAAQLLAGRKGPLRLVLTTDTLLAPSYRDAHALAALAGLPARAVVHVVVPQLGEDEAQLARDDTHALAVLPARHRGIFAELRGAQSGEKLLSRAVLGLVRPVQIDNAKVSGLPDVLGDDETTLREGTGLRRMLALATAPDQVIITGKLWGDSVRRVVRAGERFSVASAGWVFAEDEHGVLSEREMMRVALRGRAVSPVTSYLAIEPGTRPSTVGLELSGTGYGSGSGGGHGYGSGSAGVRTPPDLMALVASQAAACVASHPPAPAWQLTLNVDTTYDEVVDVLIGERKQVAAALASCLSEAVWAVRLDPRFTLAHERFSLAFH